MHRALLAQDAELACALIESGAHLAQTLSPGDVPSLAMASYLEDGDATVVNLMLEHGVDVTKRTTAERRRSRGHDGADTRV